VSHRPDASTSTLFDDLRDVVVQRAEADGGSPWPLCGTGVALRALLLVHAALGIGLCFGAGRWLHWLAAMGAAATVAVPATLAWWLLACLAGRWLQPQAASLQFAVLSALGALSAGLAWRLLDRAGLAPPSATGMLAPALTGAALAALLWLSVRWRQRARLPAAAAARLADLQTRIRPHFLFNTLNTAIALVQLDPRRAEEVLEDLSDLFRATLGALDKATTLAEEIELSRRYLSIEQLRFGRRLDVDWDLDPTAGAARLPPLALQPLIENAVRHGIEPSDRGGTVEVRTRRRRDRVLVSVTNTVQPGAAPRPGHGIGLASVRERLRLLHDLDADFRSGVIEDGRWRVSLSVPAE
jgi:two-component system sensor histidine kinase AlgZ